MESFEIKPTYENLLRTFIEDSIGRDNNICKFVELLDLLDGSYSIALEGAWGSGKTFFVKQTKMVLDAHNNFIVNEHKEDNDNIKAQFRNYMKSSEYSLIQQVCVYYDAWENDGDSEPMLSLVHSIIKSVGIEYKLSSDLEISKIINGIAKFFGTNKFEVLIDAFKTQDYLEQIKQEKSIESLIKEFLESILYEHGERLVIFIDELDRCKPTFAVKLLERIKHYFDNDRITFVFSINAVELQHTIQNFYGTNFDSNRYLDRFFDLRISLPPIEIEKYYNLINFENNNKYINQVISAVIKEYDLQLREISRYLSIVKLAVRDVISRNYYGFSEEMGEHFSYMYIVPIMIGLIMTDNHQYKSFISGKDVSPLYDIAKHLEYSSIFNYLLGDGESYDKTDTNCKTVVKKDRLEAVYKAIFVTEYRGSNYETIIGKCSFSSNNKKQILNLISLLSKYNRFE